ncbi:MAG: HlyD family efflux transporter periplasmic adaptor subunit [Verrucomicrobiae bacterium]|nr:HlyD family efflux transporter periplasmic adaptor subunit [Verrucomicrobiae bacterium]
MEKLQQSLRIIRIWILTAVLGFGLVLVGLIAFVPVDEKVNAGGIVMAEEERFLYAPEDGILQEVKAYEGTRVAKGDLILLLDAQQQQNWKSQIEAEIKEAQAALDLKKVQLEKVNKLPLQKEFWHSRSDLAEAQQKAMHAEAELRRYTQLLGEKLTSQSEYEARKLASDMAQSELAKAKENVALLDRGLEETARKEALADLNAAAARLDRLSVDLKVCEEQIERREIRAPMDGVVTLVIKRRPGERVVRGDDLAHVSGGEPMRVKLFVGENQVHRIRIGQHVKMRSNVFEFTRFGYIHGTVKEVALEAYPRQTGEPVKEGSYLVVVHVEETPARLVLGSTVEAGIILRRVPIWKLLLPEDLRSERPR